MNYKGRWLNIESFKHDGSIHRKWDRCFVLDCNDDYIIVATKRAKVVESNGRCWFTKEPAVTIFSLKEWWNTISMLKDEGIVYYCNIASPAIIENSTIKYIDYDLDTKLFYNDDIRLLDEKEYIRHKSKYKYSDDLDFVLRKQTEHIIEKMKARSFPFEDEKIKEFYSSFLSQTSKK